MFVDCGRPHTANKANKLRKSVDEHTQTLSFGLVTNTRQQTFVRVYVTFYLLARVLIKTAAILVSF